MRIRLSIALAASLLIPSIVSAQDPVTLPGVKVTADILKPGPKILAGFVVDTAGNPIPGAEVIVPGLRRRVFTRADGSFRLDSTPVGKYEMRARKIGFAAQVRTFEVDSAGGVGQFSLLPIVPNLPAMLTSANRKGLSGNVADLEYTPVPRATVRVLGMGLSTRTDSIGDFFLPAEPGKYMVSIAKDSFTTKLIGVVVPKDSGRHVNAWLMPSIGTIPKEEFWNVEDFRERAAWAKPQRRVLFTHEDLVRMRIEWGYDAIAATSSAFRQMEPYSKDCMVVINGGPDIANIANITVDDIETIEVYPSYSAGTPTHDALDMHGKLNQHIVSAYITQAQLNVRFAVFENRTRNCPGAYVWLR